MVKDIWDYLTSPAGQEMSHAIVVLILAVSGWVQWQTRKQTKRNAERLENHINTHEIAGDTTTGSTKRHSPP